MNVSQLNSICVAYLKRVPTLRAIMFVPVQQDLDWRMIKEHVQVSFNPFPNTNFRLFQTQRVCRRQFLI